MKHVILILFLCKPILSKADTCLSWFQDSKIKLESTDCQLKCSTLKVDMITFDCTNRCEEFCHAKKCEHDSYWKSKIKDGRPQEWDFKSEYSSSWTEAEKGILLAILDRLPEQIKNIPFDGFYRMKQSIDPTNPGTTHDNSIAIYNRAFDNPSWSTEQVVAHELGHLVFNNLKDAERDNYKATLNWKKDLLDESSRPGDFVSSRAKDNSDEDFAENFKFFLLQPEVLKSKVPLAYQWILKTFTAHLKLKEECLNEKAK